MKKHKISEAQKCDREWGDYPLTILIINPINRLLLKWLKKTNVTPNQLTVLSFAIIVAGAVLIVFRAHWIQAVGGILILTGFFIDCLDGDLARLKNMKSPLGAMLDPMLDRFGESAIAIGSALSGWCYDGSVWWLIGGMFLIAMSQIYFYIVDALVWKLRDSAIDMKKKRPKLMGTAVRFGTIEPFMWGQSFLAWMGISRWGVVIFGIMFTGAAFVTIIRLIKRGKKASDGQTDFLSVHSR